MTEHITIPGADAATGHTESTSNQTHPALSPTGSGGEETGDGGGAARAAFAPRAETETEGISLGTSAWPADGAGAPDTVSELRALLGVEAVLIPIKGGEKRPSISGWQTKTTADMADPAYLAQLRSSPNMGVLLGAPSGGLCTIDIDDDAGLEAVLEANPRLRDTLRTSRVRGANLWVRVRGSYPKSARITRRDGAPLGEWRADGNQTVIFGAAMDPTKGEADPAPYRRVVGAPPIEIGFDEIAWPPDVDFPPDPGAEALARLCKAHGEPFLVAKRSLTINESFWAALLAEEHIIVYEPGEKQFYRYDPVTGLYLDVTVDSLKAILCARMLEVSRVMSVPGLEWKRTDSTLNHILGHLRGITEHRHAFADSPVKRVHLANGVLVFDGSYRLMPFSPEFLSRNRSPIPFVEGARCDRFLNELLFPAVHPADAILIQKYAGLCLLGDNLIQRLLILDGMAGRGKTQLATAIQLLVGRVNFTELQTRHLAERFEIARYLGKTLLVGVDVAPDFLNRSGTSVLKGLVGGDLMDAERKGSNNNFQVRGNFCVVITSNARLRVRLQGDLGAWRRRLLIVRFEGPIPEKKIPNFGKELIETEGPGILNWALEGLKNLFADLAQPGGDIVLTEPQTMVVDNLLAESDSLRHFLHDCVEVAAGRDLTVAEIVEQYAQYCPERGWKAMPITTVQEQLEGLMLEIFGTAKANSIPRDGKGQRGYRRVGFKEHILAASLPDTPEEGVW